MAKRNHFGQYRRGSIPKGICSYLTVWIVPRDFTSLFEPGVPTSLLIAIRGLVKYDPQRRLTSQDCLEHPHLS